MNLHDRVLELKKEKNAVILVHNYQLPEIQDVADVIGDSLGLSQAATKTDADIIAFCGVTFMAETAKILNPDKKVIVPDMNAGCPLAEQLKTGDLLKAKKENPDAEVVLYINTNAKDKVLADCICTSSNAPEIVDAMASDTVIFGPDCNLGYYARKRTKKKLVLVPEAGHCATHYLMSMGDLAEAKRAHPDAKVIVHPEVIPELQEAADAVGSTGGILNYCRTSKDKEFIIGTENGMLYRLRKEMPGKKFYPLSEKGICSNMKKNSLEKLVRALETEKPEIIVPDPIQSKARAGIERMLEITG